MGNDRIFRFSRRPGRRTGCGTVNRARRGFSPVSRLLTSLILTGTLLTCGMTRAAEKKSGIIIYTTLDHGRDETAIAVPFIKAEQFALVTNVTTPDSKSIRVTNNQLKEIVRPPDLSRMTVVDEAGLRSLKDRAGAFRALQTRFPRAASALEGTAGEMERLVQVIEGGNVLFEGRVLPRADYDRQVAAIRGKAIDITLNGRNYTGARLSSVGDGKVSITHSGGVASIPLDSLGEEAITRLNETTTGALIQKPAAQLPVAAAPTKPEASQPPAPPAAVTVTTPTDRPTDTPIRPPLPSAAPPLPSPPKTKITVPALRALLEECLQLAADIGRLRGEIAGSNLGGFRIEVSPELYDSLRNKLRKLGTLWPDDDRVPDALIERISSLAALNMDFRELQAEISLILAEIDRVAPPKGDFAGKGSQGPITFGETEPVVGDVKDELKSPTVTHRQTPAPLSPFPDWSPSPILLLLAGLLAFAATGGAFLFQRHKERIAASTCLRCGSRDGDSHRTDGESVTCAVCHHEYVATTPPCAKSPGILVYGGVATGSLLLLASLLIQVERASTTLADSSRYTLADYPADLQKVRLEAEAGNHEAQFILAHFHDGGTADHPSDPGEAAIWYVAAAEGGAPSAQYDAGLFFVLGAEETRDPEKGERWMVKAAEQDFERAQIDLGLLYRGQSVLPYKPEESVRWLTRAAALGSGEAMYFLAMSYAMGVDVPPDFEEGKRWFQKSVEAGYGPAVEMHRATGERMEAQAEEMWSQAAESLFGAFSFSPPSPSTYVPPQYRDDWRTHRNDVKSSPPVYQDRSVDSSFPSNPPISPSVSSNLSSSSPRQENGNGGGTHSGWTSPGAGFDNRATQPWEGSSSQPLWENRTTGEVQSGWTSPDAGFDSRATQPWGGSSSKPLWENRTTGEVRSGWTSPGAGFDSRATQPWGGSSSKPLWVNRFTGEVKSGWSSPGPGFEKRE